MYGYPEPTNIGNNFGQNQRNMGNLGNYGAMQSPTLDERIWVSNQQSAEAYPIIAPNSFIRLWDSSQQKFYEKTSDCNGRPLAMKIFEYKEVLPVQETQSVDYVSSKEFAEFKEQVNGFIKSLEAKEVKKNAKQSNATNADA